MNRLAGDGIVVQFALGLTTSDFRWHVIDIGLLDNALIRDYGENGVPEARKNRSWQAGNLHQVEDQI